MVETVRRIVVELLWPFAATLGASAVAGALAWGIAEQAPALVALVAAWVAIGLVWPRVSRVSRVSRVKRH